MRVEAIVVPRRLALRLIRANIIKNHSARSIAQIEKAYDNAPGGAFPIIVLKFHAQASSWLLTVKLRGREKEPGQSRGRTLSSRARGDTTEPHGTLQRLLEVSAT
jgi:hypothetical protein